MDITERLKYLVSIISGGNVAKFARGADIIPNTIHNYLKGRPPNIDSLINIQRHYKVNINWLLTGEGETFLDKPTELPAPVPLPSNVTRFPQPPERTVLEDTIAIIEQWEHDTGAQISPIQKARLYSMLAYNESSEQEMEIQKKTGTTDTAE